VTRRILNARGFTIAELAVALAILALLIFGAMVPFSAQVEIRNVNETRRTMDTIKEAIIGFAQATGRLPCPADGTVAAGTLGAGKEQFASPSCNATFGAVPWATLGTPETDSWGRRFSYWVSPIFADDLPPTAITFSSPGQSPACTPNPAPTQASFALCSQGILTVNTRSENTRLFTSIGSGLPVVIISHGKNGSGAYTSPGITLPAPTGADEAANATHSGGTTFVSRNPTASASGCNDNSTSQSLCEYDDIVTMIPSSVLVARLVAAGRLP
jgi:prepilin-type N-terminal cleavage/methylation domain-containing protein